MKYFFHSILILVFLVSNLYEASAQSSSKPIILDNIQINNQEAELTKENKIYGKEGDAIRIGGKLLKGDSVLVYVGEKEYIANLDENMNWFVLFSITNFSQKQYPIEAQLIENNQKEDKVLLTTLILSEKPLTDKEIDDSNKEKEFNIGFKDVVIFILSLSLGYTLLNYFILKSKVKKRKRND